MYKDSKSEAKICIIENGKERCMDISGTLKPRSFIRSFLIGLTISFLLIFTIASVMSWLEGGLGYNLIAGLKLSGIILLFPASAAVFIAIIYYVYKTVGFDETVNTIIVLLVIIGLGVAAYFLYVWFAVPVLLNNWALMSKSW